MSIHENEAKQAFHDKIESQIKSIVGRLEALKTRAERARADATEAKEHAELQVMRQAIEHLFKGLKKSAGHEHEWEHSKTALLVKIAEFEALVKALESKDKAKAKEA